MAGGSKVKRVRTVPDFEDLLRLLNRGRVRYLIAGGTAVWLHGVPRFTWDLDLYAALDRKNVLRLVRVLGRAGYRPAAPIVPEDLADPAARRRWIREKDALVISFLAPGNLSHPVDIFIQHRIPFEKAWLRRRIVRDGRLPLPVLGVRDLIALKRIANRLQDVSDIANLKTLYEPRQKKKT